jgi:hypothetical protein
VIVKATAIKKIANDLVKKENILGCVYITPSADSDGASDWLAKATTGIFGPIIPAGTTLSNIPCRGDTLPCIFIIDQLEGSKVLSIKLERFVINLAYDSYDCNVLVSRCHFRSASS